MSANQKPSIDEIYARSKSGSPETVYADWAAQYDADNMALGFRLPFLAAAFAARHVPLDAGPVLDAGAGTGMVGASLAVLGYDEITAIDISEPMLAVAERTGAYSVLKRQVLGEPLDFPDGSFAATLCIGSFGEGHAPAKALEELVRVTRRGGTVIFNVPEANWSLGGFAPVIDDLTHAGRWLMLEERSGWRAYVVGETDLTVRLFVFRVT
ncbi:MAG: class I SAM-dependent methyltransferase [Pseudomonadota bacterium]